MAEQIDTIADEEYDPSVEPKSSRAWLNLIEAAEKAFKTYQLKADKIDKLYADLENLATDARDREFQLFWANIEVLKPSIYSRPPAPVVVPKFKDRRPLYRVSSELLERSTIVAFDMTDIDQVMMATRDDLAIVARGAPWVRYETKAESDGPTESIRIEHLDRKDFLHDPARKWAEVGWVARRGWLTKREMRKRFYKHSGDAYKDAEYAVRKEDKENGAADNTRQAGVWEIWSKTENKVVWVAEGCEKVLDEGAPHLKLEGFFPCPRPAYATLQRRSLIPVPDMLYYKDQLEEINELTARIHLLADAVKVRGFYPAGAGEIGDAIQQAMQSTDNRQVMVGVSNFAAFGNGSAKDTIIWLPIEMIANVIAQLIEMRRQIIEDVYQIMGLSDIMRGSTEKGETATAQQIKAQYGSVRIRDKVAELVRVARDIVRIVAEIMAEEFDSATLLDMSQMEIPTDADIARQIDELTTQAEAQLAQMVEQAMQAPEAQQMAQQNPQQAQHMYVQAQQQVIAQVQPEIAKLEAQPTVEKIMAFLRDEKIRPFSLDIETDSTITPDEDAEKERRNEFMQVFMTASQGLAQMVAQEPSFAPLAGELLKFTLSPYRAGRELEGVIDEFVDSMAQRAQQPQPNPEAEAAQAEMEMEKQRFQMETEKAQAEMQAKQQEMALKAQIEQQKAAADMEAKQIEAQSKQAEQAAKIEQMTAQGQRDAQKHQAEMEKSAMEMRKLEMEIARINTQTEAARQGAEINAAKAMQPETAS